MPKGLKFAKDAAFLDFIAESNQMLRMWLWRSMVIGNLPPSSIFGNYINFTIIIYWYSLNFLYVRKDQSNFHYY